MSKQTLVTCEDCYFRRAGLCALPLAEPCPTFRLHSRGSLAPPVVRGKTVILVDDGLATGASMHAAAAALRRQDPARIVVAVPVGAPPTCEDFGPIVDEVICAETPEPFTAVGQWYDDFSQTSDEEVRDLLERARTERPSTHPRGWRSMATPTASSAQNPLLTPSRPKTPGGRWT